MTLANDALTFYNTTYKQYNRQFRQPTPRSQRICSELTRIALHRDKWKLTKRMTSTPVIRTGVYLHMPIAVTSQGYPKWSPWTLCNLRYVQHRNCCRSRHILRQKYDLDFWSPKVIQGQILRYQSKPTWVLRVSAVGGQTLYLSPFSRYFESKDCNLDL